MVSGQLRMGQRPGKYCVFLLVLCIMAHRTHKRMLGQIKELNLIRDSWVAWNRQKYTRPMLKLSHIHRNVEESQKSGALDFFYPTIQRTCHQRSFYNANWLVLNTTWSGHGGCGLSSWILLTHSGMWSRSRDLFFFFFFFFYWANGDNWAQIFLLVIIKPGCLV